MTDLTEKWKNGELKSGYYYVIVKEEFSNRIDFYNSSATIWSYHSNDVINQVLAPVPSYEEYMCLVDYKEELTKACKMRDKIIKKYEDIDTWWKTEYEKLKEDNYKLKELLKECRDVAEFTKTIVNKHKWFDEVITKIDEVLK